MFCCLLRADLCTVCCCFQCGSLLLPSLAMDLQCTCVGWGHLSLSWVQAGMQELSCARPVQLQLSLILQVPHSVLQRGIYVCIKTQGSLKHGLGTSPLVFIAKISFLESCFSACPAVRAPTEMAFSLRTFCWDILQELCLYKPHSLPDPALML